jgi:hypothetical protein
MTWYIQGVSYPFNSRDELVEQMPILNKKFLKYADFAKATATDVLNAEQMAVARKYYIYTTRTAVLLNDNGKFQLKPLPVEAQFSIVDAILYKDYDGDGRADIFMAGNFFPFRVQQGRCDAGMGLLLKGDGKGNFTTVPRTATGVYVPGDVRDMAELQSKKGSVIIISKNNDTVQVLRKNQ